MRKVNNFSVAQGLEFPLKGQYHSFPTDYTIYRPSSHIQTHKPFLISSTTADTIVKYLAVASLFCALFIIGFNA
ncbi:MAG: hypothetical protein IT245_08880 [Bacteroidia bacterium]|nr:hypothetical protein [Bacteroidia bacterium]